MANLSVFRLSSTLARTGETFRPRAASAVSASVRGPRTPESTTTTNVRDRTHLLVVDLEVADPHEALPLGLVVGAVAVLPSLGPDAPKDVSHGEADDARIGGTGSRHGVRLARRRLRMTKRMLYMDAVVVVICCNLLPSLLRRSGAGSGHDHGQFLKSRRCRIVVRTIAVVVADRSVGGAEEKESESAKRGDETRNEVRKRSERKQSARQISYNGERENAMMHLFQELLLDHLFNMMSFQYCQKLV